MNVENEVEMGKKNSQTSKHKLKFCVHCVVPENVHTVSNSKVPFYGCVGN